MFYPRIRPDGLGLDELICSERSVEVVLKLWHEYNSFLGFLQPRICKLHLITSVL